MTIPLSAARAVALHTQKLATATNPPATHKAITAMVEQTGAIQIDTIAKVARSHYIAVWSRFGTYDRQIFDDLIYTDGERTLFEYWKKAASIIPFSEYAYHLPMMARRRDNPSEWWRKKFLGKPQAAEVLDHVRTRLAAEGPLRTGDFKGERQEQWSGWAAWKPAKFALEHLFNCGEAMVSARVRGFQRAYDLAERVRPPGTDLTPHTLHEHRRYRLMQAARSAGIATANGIIDYAYMKKTPARPVLAELIADGSLQEVTMETISGEWVPALIHPANADLIQRALEGDITPNRTTFLTFFDSLLWPNDRNQQLWGFENVLEAYKKKEDRRWGYFSLPILHQDALIGRFDPTLDRKTHTLTLHALYLEEDLTLTEEIITAVATTLRDFMAFHRATDLTIESSHPPEYGPRVLAAM